MTELVKKEENALSTQIYGFEEDIDQSDIIMPRAVLLQQMSPILEDNSNLKAGMIINNLTNEVLDARFIPILVYKEYIKFNPRDKNDPNFNSEYKSGALIWRTRDKNDPRVAKECSFGGDGSKPTALTFMNFLGVFEGSETPIVLGFAKTSYKTGKMILSTCKLRNKSMFESSFQIGSKLEKNDLGSYYVYTAKFAGEPENKDKYFKLWQNYSKLINNITVDYEDGADKENLDEF